MDTKKTRVFVTHGPSKWDLMLALFDSTKKDPRIVVFKTERFESKDIHLYVDGKQVAPTGSWHREIEMTIKCVEQVADSPDSFKIEGSLHWLTTTTNVR
ncbi:MAG TPA: hypothetical protein VGC58_00190, partial [Candidatus Paceibacterota bacterium]